MAWPIQVPLSQDLRQLNRPMKDDVKLWATGACVIDRFPHCVSPDGNEYETHKSTSTPRGGKPTTSACQERRWTGPTCPTTSSRITSRRYRLPAPLGPACTWCGDALGLNWSSGPRT
ncbi:unnamed protein product [Ectocarpus sp. 12 AP-2014]